MQEKVLIGIYHLWLTLERGLTGTGQVWRGWLQVTLEA
jgi:hypothetical protein